MTEKRFIRRERINDQLHVKHFHPELNRTLTDIIKIVRLLESHDK
jgi:hypothetical protein